jgi:hypothetical protein
MGKQSWVQLHRSLLLPLPAAPEVARPLAPARPLERVVSVAAEPARDVVVAPEPPRAARPAVPPRAGAPALLGPVPARATGTQPMHAEKVPWVGELTSAPHAMMPWPEPSEQTHGTRSPMVVHSLPIYLSGPFAPPPAAADRAGAGAAADAPKPCAQAARQSNTTTSHVQRRAAILSTRMRGACLPPAVKSRRGRDSRGAWHVLGASRNTTGTQGHIRGRRIFQ